MNHVITPGKDQDMTNSTLTARTTRTDDPISNLAAEDSTGTSISETITELTRDAGLMARRQLRRARGQEAVRLAETALAEYMAAKRRTFVYQVGLAEDHSKKLMLRGSMERTAAVEREIARIITEAVSSFEGLIMGSEEQAYRSETQLVRRIEAAYQAGEISERRYTQQVENIGASTDKIVETVQSTTRQILANLERRFHAALAEH